MIFTIGIVNYTSDSPINTAFKDTTTITLLIVNMAFLLLSCNIKQYYYYIIIIKYINL